MRAKLVACAECPAGSRSGGGWHLIGGSSVRDAPLLSARSRDAGVNRMTLTATNLRAPRRGRLHRRPRSRDRALADGFPRAARCCSKARRASARPRSRRRSPRCTATELIRLQCYEGLDQNAALYEWNYQRQLLAIKAREGAGEDAERDRGAHLLGEAICSSGRCSPRSGARRRRCC